LRTRRKQHKKDQVTEVARKKRRNANKATARAIVGVSLEVINKRRTEKPEVGGRKQLGAGAGHAYSSLLISGSEPGAVEVRHWKQPTGWVHVLGSLPGHNQGITQPCRS
jgi:hypothetical protein